ncbi:MAG: alpha/beta fold hydrolase [Pseudomonadota bacterium]
MNLFALKPRMDDLDLQAEALLAGMAPSSPSAAPGQNMLPPNTRRDVEGLHALSPVWRAGDGPATLFVHGWDDTHRVWRRFGQDWLMNARPLLLMDLPGHGASKAEDWTWKFAGQAVADVCAAEGPVDAVVAHSFGCAAAARALELGADIPALVLIAPALRDEDRDWAARQREAGVDEAVLARALELFETRMGGGLKPFDIQAELAAYAGRLLLIGSAADEDCPLEPIKALCASLPNATLHAVDHLDHRDLAQDGDILAVIRAFLNAV